MGDTGSSSASGGSSLSSSDLNSLFSDANLGDQMTGGSGDIFGGSSAVDLSNLFADAGLGANILGDASGLGGAFSTVTDPSGQAAASLSATPPSDAASTPAGSDPAGNIGGTGSGGAPQPSQSQPQPSRPVTPTPQPSGLDQLAKLVKGAFGLGALPSAGGPTGFTALPAGAGAAEGAGLGAVAAPLAGAGFLLPFMTNPLQQATGVEAPRTLGRSPTGPPDPTQQPARPVTPTPPPAGVVDPEIAAGGPGAGAGQPPADPAQPAPAPAAAPAAPPVALPTKKGPEDQPAPEAAPGPSEGQGGPTGDMGGILRDILGLALGSPTLLPILAQLMMGGRGRGRGGIPPWAMHGMMPFMRGTRRGFVGFRGGFLRPGYYPRRQGGWGFHPGGYHPGWGAWAPGVMGNQPMAFAGGGQGGGGTPGAWAGANVQSGGAPDQPGAGADQSWKNSGLSSNPFLNTLVGQESGGGQNIVSRTDKDSRGLTLAQGGNPAEISQGYFQIQNHPGGTWSTYARQAGVDLSKYPTPRSAPLDVQWQVASRIPIREWGPDTQVALQRRGFRYSPEMTLGQVAQANGGVNPTAVASNPSSSTSRQPGFRIRDSNPDPLTSHTYPAPTETGGAQPVQSDDFASAG